MTRIEFNEYLVKKFPRTSSALSGFIMVIVDCIMLFFCLCLGFFIVNLFNKTSINFKSFVSYSFFIPILILCFEVVGLYPGIMIPPTEQVKKFTVTTFFGYLVLIIFIFVSDYNDLSFKTIVIKDSEDIAVSIAIFISFLIGVFFLPAGREFAKRIVAHTSWWGVPAVIYTDGNNGDFVIEKLKNNKYLGYHPAVIIDTKIKEPSMYKDIPVFPIDSDIIQDIHSYNIKTAVFCDFEGDESFIMTGYRYTISVSKNQNLLTATQQLKDIAGILAFSSIHNLSFKGNRIAKRLLDIFIVLLFLPIILPLTLILAGLTKITSKGPVFYGHERIGLNGKPFKCWKFRSMVINSDEMLNDILANDPVRQAEWEKDRKFTDDPRITKFGKFLRKTSLDELPQILNIFLGQMSFVGPRPVTEPELDKYGKFKDYVLSAPPGLTGMWQVSGRSDTGYEERISFDTYYIQNWSIWLDIWILIKTVYVVVRHKGAY